MLTISSGFFLFSGLVVLCFIQGVVTHYAILRWGPLGRGAGSFVSLIGAMLILAYLSLGQDLLHDLRFITGRLEESSLGMELIVVTCVSLIATILGVGMRLEKTRGIKVF